MDMLHNLTLGFSVALSFQNLLYALIGCMVGTLIGVLPGIGPVATIAMLLPITFHLPPTAALIMLAGIYYGAQYGGSTTSILVNLPGEASSVVTCIDGYQMARKGRAGAALTISALGSFFAGTVGTLVIVLFAEPLTRMAQKFGPADYCSLMALGLVAAIVLANGSVLKAIAMVFLGLLFGLVGTDVNTGAQRFTFDIPELSDGIDFAPIAMGLFGIAEIVVNLEKEDVEIRGHQGDIAVAHARGDAAVDPGRHPRDHSRLASWAFCRAAVRPWAPSRPIRWRRRSPSVRRSSARVRWKASRRLNRRTTPPPRHRSSRC